MKRNLLRLVSIGLAIGCISFFEFDSNKNRRARYTEFLAQHQFSEIIPTEVLATMPKKDRPDLAMRQNVLMTMDPRTKAVPTEKLIAAFEKQKRLGLERSNVAFEGIPDVVWQERGPNNVGGRTRALMWDPNDSENKKLWAGSVSGGIWFNNDVTDASSTWQKVDDFLANLAINSLAFDPNNTQVFYAGTGEGYFNFDAVRGAGIFKSTDGGATWDLLPSTQNSTFHYVQKILVTTDGTLIATTRNGGVQRSTNDGESWSTVLSSSNAGAFNNRANDLEIAANGDIYATMGIFNRGSIHRSSDDGLTWEAITPSGGNPQRIELAVSPSVSSETSNTVLFALASSDNDVAWLKKTIDGGQTWIDLDIPRYRSQNCTDSNDDFTRGQAWYDLVIAVHPNDTSTVLAGGINVLKSSDGGVNMSEVSYWTGSDTQTTCDDYVHADIHTIIFRPNHPNEAVIGSDGGVSYSPDIGTASNPTFDSRNKNYNVTQFYAAAAENTSDKIYYLAGSQDNGTHQFTEANGLSTVEVTGGDGGFCFIDQDNGDVQISSFVRNVYFLLDGNGNFVTTLSNDQNSGRFINPADYDNETDVLYSAGNANQLKRISNLSTSPTSQVTLQIEINGEQISAIRADADSLNRIFVGTGSGGVYRIDSIDTENPTVTDITGNISDFGNISSLDLGLSDDEIIVTLSNYGVNSVWYTTDGGENWLNKDNDGSLPDIPVRWALINPNNAQQVMLATELGVWSTTDITATNPNWEQTSQSLANVRCDMLQYRASDKQVIVATHGRGLFTTNVFGGADTEAPTIISRNPDNGENEVRLDVELNVTFSEAIVKATGSIIINEVNDGANFEIIDITSTQASASTNVLSIKTSSVFSANTQYEVTIDAGAITDNNGNPFAGIGTDEWRFTTFNGDEPPVLLRPIPDQALQIGGDIIELDLVSFFQDPDGDVFSYSVVSNSNASLVNAAIANSILTLSSTSNEEGNAEIILRAQTNDEFVEEVFNVQLLEQFLFFQGGTQEASASSQIFPDFDNSELETADNFLIPEGESWAISSIEVMGENNGLVPELAIFRIYEDQNDEPGQLLFESEPTAIESSDYEIELASPFSLREGNYWISVLAIQEFGEERSRWFWAYSLDGDGYLIRDADLLTGGGLPQDWGNGAANGQLLFGIFGVKGILEAPSGLSIAEDESGIMLMWNDNSSDEDNFLIERAFSDGVYQTIDIVAANSQTYVDAALDSTNVTVTYRVSALNADGILSSGAEASHLTLPEVPQLLEPSVSVPNAFTLNWAVEDGATSFILDISQNEDFETFLEGFENLEVNELSFSTEDIDEGRYFYRVASSNSTGTSPFSETGSVIAETLLGISGFEVNVYPNPTSGVIHLESDFYSNLTVLDLSGRVLKDFDRPTQVLDLSELKSGVYLLRLQFDSGVYTTRIVKK